MIKQKHGTVKVHALYCFRLCLLHIRKDLESSIGPRSFCLLVYAMPVSA